MRGRYWLLVGASACVLFAPLRSRAEPEEDCTPSAEKLVETLALPGGAVLRRYEGGCVNGCGNGEVPFCGAAGAGARVELTSGGVTVATVRASAATIETKAGSPVQDLGGRAGRGIRLALAHNGPLGGMRWVWQETRVLAVFDGSTWKRPPETSAVAPSQDAGAEAGSPLRHVVRRTSVRDTATNLLWQRTPGTPRTYSAAKAYCAALRLEGHDDWRLPHEIDNERGAAADRAHPPNDVQAFGRFGEAWVVTTPPPPADLSEQKWVRCVRTYTNDNEAPLPSSFDTLTDAVRDNDTRLTWQLKPQTRELTFGEARAFCASASFAGKGGWRLPTAWEVSTVRGQNVVDIGGCAEEIFWRSDGGLTMFCSTGAISAGTPSPGRPAPRARALCVHDP